MRSQSPQEKKISHIVTRKKQVSKVRRPFSWRPTVRLLAGPPPTSEQVWTGPWTAPCGGVGGCWPSEQVWTGPYGAGPGRAWGSPCEQVEIGPCVPTCGQIEWQTDTTENITFPETRYVEDKNKCLHRIIFWCSQLTMHMYSSCHTYFFVLFFTKKEKITRSTLRPLKNPTLFIWNLFICSSRIQAKLSALEIFRLFEGILRLWCWTSTKDFCYSNDVKCLNLCCEKSSLSTLMSPYAFSSIISTVVFNIIGRFNKKITAGNIISPLYCFHNMFVRIHIYHCSAMLASYY